MKSLLKRSKVPIGAFVVVALVLLAGGLFGILSTPKTHADSQSQDQRGRLVTIYDRGTEKVILTNSDTIGGALKEAGVTLAKEDVVEPAASQKLVTSEYKVNIYRARPVVVVDGNIREKIMTPYQTADQIAKSAGITLYPEDTTALSQISDLADGAGLQLTITRATPISFVLYGTPTAVRTQAKTVGEMLKQKGITMGANDTLSVPASTPITANMSVELWRNGVQTANVQEDIPYDTQVIQDADQPVGYTAVQTPGVNGKKTVTYQIEMKNGVEVSRTQIQSVTTAQPTTEVDVHGSKLQLSAGYSAQRVDIMSQAGIAPSDYAYAAYIVDHENGMWCPTRWQGQSVCSTTYVALYSPDAQVGYGLCQATPGSKMATAGSDWQTNPVTQMKWCTSYAVGRYGSWYAAYTHWIANHNW